MRAELSDGIFRHWAVKRLKDKNYIMIKKLIRDLKKQYAVLVYNFDNSDIFDKTIEFQINDQLFFEVLLMEIRGKTISYAAHKKRGNEAGKTAY